MAGICDGRVVVITGAGRGIGREHALAFARQGARLVVNDLGGQLDGSGSSEEPAEAVAAEIRDLGGEAVSNFDNVADTDGARRLIDTAIETFGGLDVLVNNAGIIRDRMLVNMTEDLWDQVIHVHLRGTYGPSRCAAAYWREQAKAGNPVDARIINTTSTSGIFGNIGQSNYGAAKAGIAAFTVITSQELVRYGVTVNAVSPDARTRLTENVAGLQEMFAAKPDAFDTFNPGNISPLVVWLGSPESSGVTGRVFLVHGGTVSVAEGWRRGPTQVKDGRWDPAELGAVVPGLVAQAAPNSTMAD